MWMESKARCLLSKFDVVYTDPCMIGTLVAFGPHDEFSRNVVRGFRLNYSVLLQLQSGLIKLQLGKSIFASRDNTAVKLP